MSELKSSVTRTIKWISKSGTYTAQIVSQSGDLWIKYTGTPDASYPEDAEITPDYETAGTQPILLLYVLSSKSSDLITPKSDTDTVPVKFYFNDSEITFTNKASNAPYAKCFQLIEPADNTDGCYGLKLLNSKQIAAAAGYASFSIKMVAKIQLTSGTGTYEEEITATYTVSVGQATANSQYVTIGFADSNMALTSDEDTVTLKAYAWRGTTELDADDLYYIWDRMDASGWTTISQGAGSTYRTLAVTRSMVDYQGTFRVRVWEGTSSSGTMFGQDIQDVMDYRDVYEIDPDPTPADETVTETEDKNAQTGVTYQPKLRKRGSSTYYDDVTFDWSAYDADGNVLLDGTVQMQGSNVTSFEVTYGAVEQANADVSVVISASISE